MYTPVPRLMWCWIRHKTCEASILDLDEYTGVETRSSVVITSCGECRVSLARSEDVMRFLKTR